MRGESERIAWIELVSKPTSVFSLFQSRNVIFLPLLIAAVKYRDRAARENDAVPLLYHEQLSVRRSCKDVRS